MSQVYELPKAITLTDRAAERVKSIMAKSETPKIGIRLGVKNGGCAGMEYTMDYAEEKQPLDEIVEDKGVTILIEAKAVLFLLGTEMDWEEDKLSAESLSSSQSISVPSKNNTAFASIRMVTPLSSTISSSGCFSSA